MSASTKTTTNNSELLFDNENQSSMLLSKMLIPNNNNNESEILNDFFAALSNAKNSISLNEENNSGSINNKNSSSMTLGKALQNDLKSQRLQREQNENSLSSTSSPAPTETSDDQIQNQKVIGRNKEKSPKRKRPRRNPVWAYFEIRDNIAYCMEDGCKYNTGSVYSTNLKVHLKSHHHEKYREVLVAEYRNQMVTHSQQGQSLGSPAMMGTSLMIPNLFDQNVKKEITERHPTLGSMLLQVKKPVPTIVVPQITEKPLASSPLLAAALKTTKTTSATTAASSPKNSTTSTTNTSAAASENNGGGESFNDRMKKRKRLRRHPVWNFFDDLDDKNIGCIQCDFKTSSGFTTNLKMHLKAHHRNDYIQVMQMECEQRKEEGCVDATVVTTHGKKKKRTAEELETMLEAYKAKHGTELDDIQQANLSPQALENLANLLQLSNNFKVDFDTSNTTDFDEDVSSPEITDPSPTELTYESLKAELSSQENKEPTSISKNESAERPDDESLSKFRDFMASLSQLANENIEAKDLIKQTRDVALGRVINEIGVQNISFITSNVFMQLLIAMDPSYKLPNDINHLRQLAESSSSHN